ncbi:MAG: serine/threonine protein kinase [Kiritimatiellae bacterium]|nr:serine/threonine protein kinase [Kiritimatiellia bacterium]
MKIPGYDIIQKLGEGAAGVVWKGHQVSLDRIVAIKILRKELLSDPEEVADFIKEARSAAQLKHPNLVQVYDIANQDGKYYFVMEYIDGPTVAQLIKDKGVIPQKHALKIIRQVAEALKSAWEQNRLIHRDVKPDNIVIDSDGTTKLADLGLAKQIGRKRPLGKAPGDIIAGTPNYMSPEQAGGGANLDLRSDMYSLGATLYHMLTGKMPFEDDDTADALNKQITDFLINPRNINPGISIGVARLITMLMMKSPTDRYADWDDVIDNIRKSQAGRLLAGVTETDGMSTIKPQKGQTNRLRSGRTAKSAEKEPTLPIPLMVKVIAWTMISAWWLLLAHIFINNRDVISKHMTDVDQFLPPPEENLLTTMPEPSAPAPVVTSSIAETTPVTQEDSDNEKPTSPLGAEPLTELKSALTDMLIIEDFAGAGAFLEQKNKEAKGKPEAPEISKVSDFVKEVSGINNAVRQSFEKSIGNTIILNHNNNKHTLLLRAISGDTINAVLITGPKHSQERKSVKFRISLLAPAERARWLKSKPNSVQNAMKYILHMKNNDFIAARKYASDCGPFSEIFIRKIQDKIPEKAEE